MNSYDKIKIDVRIKLVEMVLEGGWSVRNAAQELSVKLPTAKVIVKRYRQTGTFFEPKSQKKSRKAMKRQTAQERERTSSQNFFENINGNQDLGFTPNQQSYFVANMYASNENRFEIYPTVQIFMMPFCNIVNSNIMTNYTMKR